MSIVFDSKSKTFTLLTRSTSYQMQIGPLGHLLHLYYGHRAAACFDYLYLEQDIGFSPNPYDRCEGRGWSLDTQPQEYSGDLTGDFRLPSLRLRTESGLRGAELKYLHHEIRDEKYTLNGLPSALGTEDAQTLSVTLLDEASGVEVELLYGVYENLDVITRAVKITNAGSESVQLEQAASACLELPFGSWDLIHFHGRHTMERQPERVPVLNSVQEISSRRGASGHQHNPFVILCDHEATEDYGGCIAMMLVYSGNFRMQIEQSQTGSIRAVMGLGDENFTWRLNPGETFDTPEAILTHTDQGLTTLSQQLHRFLRGAICRGKFANAPRPILLNSWEANYFDFTADSILALAREAKALGMDLLVLDDGWFGSRDDDKRALGDWYPNQRKLPNGLRPLIQEIRSLGLQFGLWLEPEMVSEDSDLYRAHPDWALKMPGRKPAMSRDQLVLDLSRADVVEWLYETIAALLKDSGVTYIKWDMNRHLTDVFSASLPPDQQGETAHRYVLGLYQLLDRLTREFPDVLFEGCAGGGGRFDAGMLCYTPQIWCSDNTDPISRLAIQNGTAYGYPLSSISAHVSASPNHQTGRRTPLGTRFVVAMTGAFGYELDPAKLSESERGEIRTQIQRYREYESLIREGDYFRLSDSAWQIVSEDQSESLLSVVWMNVESNPRPKHFKLKGLDETAEYEVIRCEWFGCANAPNLNRESYSGAALLYGGLTLPPVFGDYPSMQLFLRKKI